MRRVLMCVGLFLSLGLLSACGGGDDALSDVAKRPNTFPPATNSVDDFTSGSTGDSSNTSGLAENEIRVTVEVPARVAPDGELTRRNLRIVTPDRIELYRSDNSPEKLGSVNADIRSEDSGRSVIRFADGVPIAPDVIIEVTVGDTRMRALAADDDRDVKVNPFSEYLVRNSVEQYTLEEFEGILACANSTQDDICLNKHIWPALADQVHYFEIDIPDNNSINEAVDLLAARADFAYYVEAMADYALLDTSPADKVTGSSADYNTVYMGIELGQTFSLPNTASPGQWGVQTAHEERVEDEYGVAYAYPALTLTSLAFLDIEITALSTDIPYARATLAQTSGNDFYSKPSREWGINTHSTSPGGATFADSTRLLAGRSLFQSITGKDSSQTVGWSRNPYALDAYVRAADIDTGTSDRVLSGHFSAGKAIELISADGKLERQNTLEVPYTSALELNLQRKSGFEATVLNGRDYNVLALTTRFNGNDSRPMSVETMTGSWAIAGGAIHQTADTMALKRDGAAVSRQTGTHNTDYLISPRASRLHTGNEQNGRLSLDVSVRSGQFDSPQIGTGASTPDGNLMAFNPLNGVLGNGILIAATQHDEPAPKSGRYRIQGLFMGLSDGSNRLTHFQGATLSIDSESQVTLSTTGLEVVHNVGKEQVTPPRALAKQNLILGYADYGNGNIGLSDSKGNLVLDGFVTEDGAEMYFVASKDDGSEQSLGVFVATRLAP